MMYCINKRWIIDSVFGGSWEIEKYQNIPEEDKLRST